MKQVAVTRSWLNMGVLTLTAWQLTGCVAGQSIALDHEPEEVVAPDRGMSVVVDVADEREFVVSGSESANYIGQYRAGFGNPWNVTTESGMTLADRFADDLAEELVNLGFSVTESDASGSLNVQIRDWNFDTYINGRFWCDIDVSVLSADGRKIAASEVREMRDIQGSVMTGAKYAMEDAIPRIYSEVIDAIARSNSAVLDALHNLE